MPRLGNVGQGLRYSEQALAIARKAVDRDGEALGLTNLGTQYANLGQTARAIEYHEQALAIDRESEDNRPNEALDLGNLGDAYASLGRTDQARQCLTDALAIARGIGDRFIEASALTYLGGVFLDQGAWGEAARAFTQAIDIADDTANPRFQQWARLGLAQTYLDQGQLAAAREMAEATRPYNFPLRNHSIPAILGVAALRQGDRMAAREAFAKALKLARELLTRGPQLYDALDTEGLALCGLALCEHAAHLPAAQAAYKAARALNADAGRVGRVLRLFDALAKADTAGLLAEVRADAAGERPQ